MPTSYEKLYENLLPKFRSYEIPLMSTEEVKDYLHDFLIPAISRFHVCRKDLNNRDDILQRFNDGTATIGENWIFRCMGKIYSCKVIALASGKQAKISVKCI